MHDVNNFFLGGVLNFNGTIYRCREESVTEWESILKIYIRRQNQMTLTSYGSYVVKEQVDICYMAAM